MRLEAFTGGVVASRYEKQVGVLMRESAQAREQMRREQALFRNEIERARAVAQLLDVSAAGRQPMADPRRITSDMDHRAHQRGDTDVVQYARDRRIVVVERGAGMRVSWSGAQLHAFVSSMGFRRAGFALVERSMPRT